MSKLDEILYQPLNGTEEQTWHGFSWPAFFFGLIWLILKGLYGHFLIGLILTVATMGFAAPVIWIAYGFMGNDIHKKSLQKKGYLTKSQWDEKRLSAQKSAKTNPSFKFEELRELGDLRDKGILTEIEFDEQKKKLLRDDMTSQKIDDRSSATDVATESDCTDALSKLGYRSTRKGSTWIVKEPLGGTAKISDINALLEYTRSKQLQRK